MTSLDHKTKRFPAGYIPVLQQGYINLFKKFKGVDTFFVFDKTILATEDYLRKDIRALEPAQAVSFIKSSGYFKDVQLLSLAKLKSLDISTNHFIFPDDDISHSVTESYIKQAKVEYYPVFLRWDRRNLSRINQRITKEETTSDKSAVSLMRRAQAAAKRSTDIWRRVGAVLVNDSGEIIDISENRSEPSQFMPIIDGDTRMVSNAGSNIEMNVFMHAEARIIARAAKTGLKLKDLTLYVTTFPCPACAMLVAESGIKKLYYKDGYALLNGADILNDRGVALIRVEVDDPDDIEGEWVKYPNKK